ncbi:hypothetical protein QWZ04_00930 [Vibrio tapetis subsp. quintayensis]|uniref:hypothetical protein n=1 Tax=Vibrio tapetis TaxID=52443 RepID=UPI0025B34D6D|nr:hypothetical protein [Vibrio tapetis]MDN3678900.1 hypothetical protein [Vibrio tapetis subsp. quintayensis]
MRHGLLACLISLPLLLNPIASCAKEITEQQASKWLEDSLILERADEMYQLVLADDISSLEFSLQRLALPQQEVVRYLLLQHMEDQELILSEPVARFVQAQLGVIATYQITEQGDGYEIVVPAFYSSVIASRLIKRREKDKGVLDFILAAEQKKLNLEHWLTGNEYQVNEKEKLLIAELDGLSPRALNALTQQLTQETITHWLPSNAVVSHMAQVSKDPGMYALLWRMRADNHSKNEIARLGHEADEFSIEQLLAATSNPSLKMQATAELTKLNPLPIEVKTYLVNELRLEEDEQTQSIARQLVDHGHRSWLEQVASSKRGVNSNILLQVLSVSKEN